MSPKRLFLSSQLNYKTFREEPQKYVGFTGDGRVGFTASGVKLVNRLEISHEQASALACELLHASCAAHRREDEARGLNEWVSKPLPDGRFEVRYHGHLGVFRAIVNGKRRLARRYIDPLQTPKGHPCSVCRGEAPEGATMFIFGRSTEKRGGFDEAASSFRHHRACQRCMRPDLNAALLGASLAGASKDGGT